MLKARRFFRILLVLFSPLGALPSAAQRTAPSHLLPLRVYDPPRIVFPKKTWLKARPEGLGLRSEALKEAARYAQKYGGGSGCVVRSGYLLYEWGSPSYLADIKSATKGSIGATLLGIALDRGLLSLDQPAVKYYPALGTGRRENKSTGYLSLIRVRHLATMTAGFDDGRPPKLVYRPGTRGLYSNDTSNMLAELLTLRFKEDLKEVLRREVMKPLGVPEGSWRWRANAYRSRKINGIVSREFASGIRITHRALARIGYLYLMKGRWGDRQILSKAYVKEATSPTELPGPYPGYAFYWVSNAGARFSGLPRDTFWALGLGDSFVAVCPSLDLVVVRLGTGSRRSQLPGPPGWGGERVAGLLRLIFRAVVEPPVPPSEVFRGLRWARPQTIKRAAKGSDNWPLTWADDGDLYTAYGDGRGFAPKAERKLSLGFAKVSGMPPNFKGSNIRSPTGERTGDGARGPKASGILMVKGVLYLLVRNTGNSQVAWSRDHARTWSWAPWRFKENFGCLTFLNFGRNYEGARDGFVYIYSPESDDAYSYADAMVMARVPGEQILNRNAYSFFSGFDKKGEPIFSPNINDRRPIFHNPGKCRRSGVSYHPTLKRYLWVQTFGKEDTRFEGGIAVYEAPEPWGPWRTVYYAPKWDIGPGESASFPTKWFLPEQKALYLVFSGNDAFSVRKAVYELW